LYKFILDKLEAGESEKEIVAELERDKRFEFLNLSEERERTTSGKISKEGKSAVFLRDAINNAPACAICGARIHRKGMSVDHIKPVREGGSGDSDNAQLAHPYCNTGYKEKLASRSQRA
jgi:5-methylcytosine-specific restriction endonuclease McrA